MKPSLSLFTSVGSRRRPSGGSTSGPAGPTATITLGRLAGLRARWRDAPLFTYPVRDEWPSSLRRLRLVGFAVLLVQLVLLCWWSSVLVHRFAVTKDYAAYSQATYLIGHGHFDPYSTIFRVQFWQNAAEFLIWPLSLILRIRPSLTTLPWLQDLALVGAEAVAFNWICEIAAEQASRIKASRAPLVLVGLGLVLLVGNPWVAWTVSFDVHLEPFIALFTVLAAHDLYRGRRRTWLWAILAGSGGVVGTTYVVGLGISAALTGRRWLRTGLGLAGVGLVWFLFLQAVHGAQASGAVEYSYLYTGVWNGPVRKGLTGAQIVIAAISHPWRPLYALWRNGVNIWASLSPGGLIGILWVPLLLPMILIAAEGGLSVPLFSRPGFQSITIAPLIAVGTVALLAKPLMSKSRRKRLLIGGVVLVLATNAIVWSILWLPKASQTWLVVSKQTASTLARVDGRIGKNDEVIATQGIIGPFADRTSVYMLYPRTVNVPVHARKVWIIIAPLQGIEDVSAHGFFAQIGLLNKMRSMHLVVAANGVWAYEWTPPAHTDSLHIRLNNGTASPAWTLTGPAGSPQRQGSVKSWYTASTGKRGYVVNRALWREPTGSYRASATLSVVGRADIEVWNDDANTLLARSVVSDTRGRRTVQLDFKLHQTVTPYVPAGWGPWSITPERPVGDDLEIRVWTPGGRNKVSVYGVSLKALTTSG